MITPFQVSGLTLLVLLAGAAALVLALKGLGLVLAILPMSRDRRELLARAAPAVSIVIGLAYALLAVSQIFSPHPDSVPVALLLVLFGFGAATWFAIRDLFAGVFLKVGRICRVGDHIRVGDVEGRVQRLGYRVVSIETSQGEEAILPYSRVTPHSIRRTPVVAGAALHVFRLRVPQVWSIAEVKRLVRESALVCHWASVTREPELSVITPEEVEVAVYALDRDHGPEVEAAVRSALGAPGQASRQGYCSEAPNPASSST